MEYRGFKIEHNGYVWATCLQDEHGVWGFTQTDVMGQIDEWLEDRRLCVRYIHPIRNKVETVRDMPANRLEASGFRFNRFHVARVLEVWQDTGYNPDSETVLYVRQATRLNSGV